MALRCHEALTPGARSKDADSLCEPRSRGCGCRAWCSWLPELLTRALGQNESHASTLAPL